MDKTLEKTYTPTSIVHRRGRPDSFVVRKTRIIVVNGPQQGEEFVTGKDYFTIGGGRKNDLILTDPSVSRNHCEIQLVPEGYLIREDRHGGTYN